LTGVPKSTATGNNATAIGNSVTATGNSVAATGNSVTATGNSVAATDNSVAAIGNNATVTGNGTAPTGSNSAPTADKTIEAGDQITLMVGKSTIVMDENGKITIKGDVDVEGVLTVNGKKAQDGVQPTTKGDPSNKDGTTGTKTPKPDKLTTFLTKDLGLSDKTVKDIEAWAPNVATGVMTMGANLLSGQKVGWSLLGGMISGAMVKDGVLSKDLGEWIGNSGIVSATLGNNIANVTLGIAGAAATGAVTADATGASITSTVAASVATNFKTDGTTLTAPGKSASPDSLGNQKAGSGKTTDQNQRR